MRVWIVPNTFHFYENSNQLVNFLPKIPAIFTGIALRI